MFKDALFSFTQVKDAISKIRRELEAVRKEIAIEEEKLSQLPLKPLPLPDLKDAILEIVDKRGAHYLESQVTHAIESWVKNYFRQTSSERGKPINYRDMESSISNVDKIFTCPQLITKGEFNDLALYAFFGELVKVALATTMKKMTAKDFGYEGLSSKDIGTDRATRRRDIQATQIKLNELRAREKELEDNLHQLGVN
jgi:hypothetical protein